MKLLVTGGLGFIGSNFISHILTNYPEIQIINLDAEVLGSNKKNLKNIKNKKYEYFKGDITDKKLLKKLISRVDTVINFAAESHVDRSINDSEPFLKSNILGVYSILDVIRKNKKNTKLLQISTDEVFGNLISGSAVEDYKLNPSSPYSSSKASAELLVNSYIITYGINAVITRCTNNYGPLQHPEKLIPKTIILADKNKKIPVYNNGKGVRDWIHVEDHCNAITKIIHDGKSGEYYNISAKNELDVFTIVQKILSIMGKSSDSYEFAENRPGHDDRYSMDSSKLRQSLGWKPRIDFEQGLEETVSWYINNRKWWSEFDLGFMNGYQWKT